MTVMIVRTKETIRLLLAEGLEATFDVLIASLDPDGSITEKMSLRQQPPYK